MEIQLNLKRKEINPGVINLRQYASGTDILTFVMDEYVYEQTDLSTLKAYAICDKGGWVDEVKLETTVSEKKLHITWKVTGYTTQNDGWINYFISFKNNLNGNIWNSHKAIIFVNSNINADDHITANYPTILQQWEQRMDNLDGKVGVDLTAVNKAVETTNNNVAQTNKDVTDTNKALTNVNQIYSNIKELVGYEPVDAIGREVMQARGGYPLLKDRLNALGELENHTHTKAQITDFPVVVSAFENDVKYQSESQVKTSINETTIDMVVADGGEPLINETFDSKEIFGGHTPDYYAKTTDLNKTNSKVDLIEKELATINTGKLYGVKIWKSSVNPTSTCEKTRDNVGLVCEPSTAKVKGRDDYENIPLFQWKRCNYKRYDDGFAYPIVFEGEEGYNNLDNADVGIIYNTFYYAFIDNGDYEELIISNKPNVQLGLRPFEEAVRADGTIMPYFIMSAYHASLGSDGLLHSLPNKKCELFMSHGLMIDKFQKKGKGYWGAGSNRYTFAQIMMLIKYGTKDIQSVMDGCISYSVQLKASIQSATKQKYFPILKSDKSKFIVGSTVSVGYGNLSGSNINNDRNIGTMHKYADRCTILRVEDLPDGTNAGVYLDSEPFDTMPVDVSGKQAEIMISSMPWSNGDTDKVIGHHDGQSVKDDKHPFRIQGIEFLNGAYFLASDTVTIFNADYSKDVYLAKRGVAHSKSETTIKNTYTKIGRIPSSSNGQGSDYWVGDITHKDGAWYPSSELSSQLSYKDRLYAGGTATSGTREFLQGGYLRLGSHAGLTFLDCWNGLSWTSWAVACAD